MKKEIQINEASALISRLYKLIDAIPLSIHLKVNTLLTNVDLSQFADFIQNQKPLPFKELSLQVSLDTLNQKQFLEILEQLNSTKISSVNLIFIDKSITTFEAEIIENLTNTIAPKISYPLHIQQLTSGGVKPCDIELEGFKNTIIANIQLKNKSQAPVNDEVVEKIKKVTDPTDPMANKIKLKTLIQQNNLRDEVISQYNSLEIQHIEAIEQEVVQQHQEVVEVETQVVQQEIQPYNGELIDFKKLNRPLYKNIVNKQTRDEDVTESLYALLKQELFANLPHAIKYVSPDAAKHLAQNLMGLVTLNVTAHPSLKSVSPFKA